MDIQNSREFKAAKDLKIAFNGGCTDLFNNEPYQEVENLQI